MTADSRSAKGIGTGAVAHRQAIMALCAEATLSELQDALARAEYPEAVDDVRRPESGLVMIRGRVGGDGAPFNCGEASVTRAVVRLASGETGFAYQLGRDGRKARAAATLDALAQTTLYGSRLTDLLAPIRDRLAEEENLRKRQTAATRVNFFTMVRGEDE